MNTKFPLQKKLLQSTNYLTPKLQFNFSPTNGRDISSDTVRLNYASIYSGSRIGRGDMVEEGRSLTLGLEFEKQDLSQTINTLAMASPFTLEEKQMLLETKNLNYRKEKLEQIINTYLKDNFSNKTIQ